MIDIDVNKELHTIRSRTRAVRQLGLDEGDKQNNLQCQVFYLSQALDELVDIVDALYVHLVQR